MKIKYIYLLFFSFLTNFLCAQDTITIYYDKKWKPVLNQHIAVFYRKAYLDSNQVWKANDYFISGKIQMTGTFTTQKFTIKQGHFIYFLENGHKSSEGNYINNKREGLWEYYSESGEKESNNTFLKDKYNGESVTFFKNGKIKSKGNYIKDKEQGVWKFWYEQGQLQSEETYNKGVILSGIYYFQNGNIQIKGDYVEGKKQGIWMHYNLDGKVIYKGHYIKNLLEGEWIRFLPDGSDMKVYYKNDKVINEQIGGAIRSE